MADDLWARAAVRSFLMRCVWALGEELRMEVREWAERT